MYVYLQTHTLTHAKALVLHDGSQARDPDMGETPRTHLSVMLVRDHEIQIPMVLCIGSEKSNMS